jgi:hypothetical protein
MNKDRKPKTNFCKKRKELKKVIENLNTWKTQRVNSLRKERRKKL